MLNVEMLTVLEICRGHVKRDWGGRGFIKKTLINMKSITYFSLQKVQGGFYFKVEVSQMICT